MLTCIAYFIEKKSVNKVKNIEAGPDELSGSGRLFPDRSRQPVDPLSSARRPNYIGWRERVRTGHMIKLLINRARGL